MLSLPPEAFENILPYLKQDRKTVPVATAIFQPVDDMSRHPSSYAGLGNFRSEARFSRTHRSLTLAGVADSAISAVRI